ncbi:SDR family NAD(P)-dependent oxidoreductase [Zobellia uliginosa]|uniref:SDR family NAD(P)-dependent oxidoreductase n=1 Tax=Zobellia uliginosa TaxID=143224 RepID=UPI0026E1B656|nr:SDR family oxidoreductase [Zobellia uliginosa]MDO6518069.1 SDR family oxidoreductase [Zobellia uliginosa]
MKKNILLIGGSYGIGLELVKQLQDEYSVYVASRSSGQLGTTDAVHLPFDSHNDTIDTTALPDQLHGFVYCPGSINLKPFQMMSLDNFETDMQLNFFNMVKVVKTILPLMDASSSIVLFSTVAVGTGMPYHTSIAAAKGAVEGFARSLAAECAPNIRVNVIAPSLVDTPLAKRLLSNDKKIEAMSHRHPLKRIGKVEDIASAAAFLLSEKSTWITGQVIGVDGGVSTLNLS